MSIIKTVIKTTNKGGRPRMHPDRRAAWAAASRAYRKRERAARTKRKAYHSSGECEWYTPASVYQPILERLSMTEFDLDPCSPWLDGPIPAKTRFTPADNGLLQPWQGVVWCNPPYGRAMAAWCDKAIQEARKGVRVIILAHARTDTKWFHGLMEAGGRPEFIKGRVAFVRPDGTSESAPFPSVLIWLGF